MFSCIVHAFRVIVELAFYKCFVVSLANQTGICLSSLADRCLFVRAQQKMLDVFQGTCKDVQHANRSVSLSAGGISKINEITGKTKDTESSSSICRNYSSWSTNLASSIPGSNKFIFAVLPTQYLDHKSSSKYPQIIMEDLDMITSFPSGLLKFREQMILGGPITDGDCNGESIIARSHKRPQLLHLPCVNCFINDSTNWNVLPTSSLFRDPSSSIEYPLVLSCGPDTTSSAYRYIRGVDDKAVQRNSKRKASRKRGKYNDLSRICSSAELNSEDGTSQTEDDRIKGMCTDQILMPYVKETVNRSNQNIIANDSGMQELVKCTFMVDTSENGFLDDGNGSMCSSAVTHPELYNSLLPGSLSSASDGGETSSVPHSKKLLKEEDTGLGILKLELCNDDKDLPSPEETQQSDVEPSNRTFRNNCVRQEIDRTSSSLEKKEYKARNLPHNSSVRRHSSLGNLNVHYGKENTHSIWKKVQRNVPDTQNSKNNKQSTNFVPSHHKHHSVPNACLFSKNEDANISQVKETKRTRRKKGLRSKQELHSACKIESHAAKDCSCVCSSVDMKKTRLSSSRQNLAGCESRSFSRKNSGAIFQAKKVESIAYKPIQKTEDAIPVLLSQTPNSVDPVMVFQVTESQCDLPSQQCNFHDIPGIHKEDSFIDDNIRTVKELPEIDYCKEKMCSTVSAEKCVSLGMKNFSGRNLGQSGFQLEPRKLDGRLHLEGITGQKSFSSPHFPLYPVKADQSMAIMSEDESSIKKLEMIGACTPRSSYSNKATNGLTCELEKPILFSSASATVHVLQAVHEGYRAQLVSEAIQSITGSPIAEFEKFIYSASPVIYGARDINNCKECLPSHDFHAPLCEHETPNLALGNIWKWYEKHGACGMEVIAKDHENSVRLGMDQFAFRAYFVPYLSAVQLFRKCKVHPNDDTAVTSRETDSSECSSTAGLASVLRKLVPQPCSVNSSTFSRMSQVSDKEASFASMNYMIDNEQSDSKSTDGVELLFEYFEYDQPQQRRPLFETIKELSSGNIPVKSRLYGDPSSLVSLGLNNLHPNSWYSVAWYPIYRIPDGKLRAAFLTYHSFGHLVRRSPKHDYHSVDVSIVSPVVGLQCYSAQGECWFKPRQSAVHKKNDVMDTDPSHVLKQRIRTLEHTASVMARASVTTGSKTYVNRQPDYEFFLSRSR